MKLTFACYLLLVSRCLGKSANGDGEPTPKQLEKRVEAVEDSLDSLWRGLLKDQDIKKTLCHMGMKSREIPDSAITSSSDADSRHSRLQARLDNQISSSGTGAWSAKENRFGEWIQVDLGRPKIVIGLATQGRPREYYQWVTSYKVACGTSQSKLMTVRDHFQEKIFIANHDMESVVSNMFPEPLKCRYVRIYPQTWHGHISMRFDLIGDTCLHIY